MARAEQMRLSETADSPYFFRNVIKNPKPIKIITWTSWNTEKGECITEGPSDRGREYYTWVNVLDLSVTILDTSLASLGMSWIVSKIIEYLNHHSLFLKIRQTISFMQ